MPRIRTIKPEFFRHEKLQDLHSENPSLNVMLVYAGLWTQCDMNGVFVWQPRQMKLDILPFIEYDMCAVLDLLTAHGFIKKFSVNGKEYGHIPTFLNNQHIPTKEKQQGARYPAYDEAKEVPLQGETRAKTRVLPPAIGAKEREREREREKEREKNFSPALNISFDEFWEHYEKKVGDKKKLVPKWERLTNDERVKAMKHISEYKIAEPDKAFRKHPETYLNQKSFNDEIIYKNKNGIQQQQPATRIYTAQEIAQREKLLAAGRKSIAP